MSVCAEPGCDRPTRSRRQTLCKLHYQQAWRARQGACTVDGCERPFMAAGMCTLHYGRTRSGLPFNAPVLGSKQRAGCGVPGCALPYHANGYCGMHAQRHRRTGSPTAVRRLVRTICIIDGCGQAHMALGYCNPHYNRVWRLGSPTNIICQSCGQAFERPLGQRGSRAYCGPCFASLDDPTTVRRRRLRAASADLTLADRRMAAEYRAIISVDPCVYCGGATEAIDHIVSARDGGSDSWDNLAPACRRCNSSKNARPLLTFMLART